MSSKRSKGWIRSTLPLPLPSYGALLRPREDGRCVLCAYGDVLSLPSDQEGPNALVREQDGGGQANRPATDGEHGDLDSLSHHLLL